MVSRELGRRYVGFEIVEEYFEFADKRLREGIYRLKDGHDEEPEADEPSLFDCPGRARKAPSA